MIKAMATILCCLAINVLPANAHTFAPCPDATDDASLASSMCLTTAVPLDPEGNTAGTVDLSVRMFPAQQPNRRQGQVWLIAGGPGEAGASLYPLIPVFRRAFPDHDLIVPDHRGTGGSTRLCPEQEAADSPAGHALAGSEWGPCIGALHADAARTRSFTITNAAHDLAALIERLRTLGDVHVYGVSYGTQLVLRMMQVAPPALDSIVLDGLVPLESDSQWDLSYRTRIVDAVGRAVLTPAQQERYVRLLAMDPATWQTTLSGGDLRQFMGTLLNFPSLRGRIPEIIDALLEQQTQLLDSTVTDLRQEFARLTPYPQSAPSLPLVGLISASENNGRKALTAQMVTDEAEDALFTSPIPGFLVDAPYPLYARDAHYGRTPDRMPRTLVIHGTLDPNTPYEGARAHAAALASSGEIHFSTVIGGAHLLPFAAPACFGDIVSAFMSGLDVPERCEFR